MVNREKQADVLRRTQAKRKERKKEQVLKAIQEIQKDSKPLTFKNIATVAGCSVSYLYKWDDIKAYIHELQQKKDTTLNSLEKPEGKYQPHSLKTLHQVAKDKIRKLEEEIKELKRQNEVLRGHVVEIYEIRDENERLLTLLRELTNSNPSSKIVPIQAPIKAASSPKLTDKDPQELVIESLKAMDIKVSYKLREEIANRDLEKVKLSIEAYQQYRDSHHVKNQEACLLSMICNQAEPNTESQVKVSIRPPEKIRATKDKKERANPKLISSDKLKKLSIIFNKDG